MIFWNRNSSGAAAVFRVAATYIGTVVGAGFASGQETLRFFTVFGQKGLWGVVLATFLFCFLGTVVMDLGRKLRARSHRQVLRYACGRRLGSVMDVVITCFLFGSLVVMLAGAGAVASEHLGIDARVGVAVMAWIAVVTVLYGISGIVAANSVIVPLLVSFVLVLTGSVLGFRGLEKDRLAMEMPGIAAAPNWFLSALLYVAYNLILSVAVLAPLGREVGDRSVILKGGILGGVVLGLLALAIKLATSAHLPEISGYQVPMLFMARDYSRPFRLGYTMVLWGEIYSTAIGSLYGFASRISEWRRWSYNLLVFATIVLAIPASGFGFATLVGILYPLFGYASLGFLLALAFSVFRGEGRE